MNSRHLSYLISLPSASQNVQKTDLKVPGLTQSEPIRPKILYPCSVRSYVYLMDIFYIYYPIRSESAPICTKSDTLVGHTRLIK